MVLLFFHRQAQKKSKKSIASRGMHLTCYSKVSLLKVNTLATTVFSFNHTARA